jgi:hypothetical protein
MSRHIAFSVRQLTSNQEARHLDDAQARIPIAAYVSAWLAAKWPLVSISTRSLPQVNSIDGVRIANDTVYGLAAYVQSKDIEHARSIALRMRAGSVYLNFPAWDTSAPFGGDKQSGNGREYADWAIHDFLEIKGIVGYSA